ncbi:MAG: triose-phosphate isomerase [Candidatus Diapherotrites archaeon]|nr:triose-phosphate isomerase [Candidatus Diapherotrites archaeon]
MKFPSLVVNFKAYEQSIGDNAVKLAQVISGANKDVVLAVQDVDVYRVSQEVKNPVFAQHVDPNPEGAFTGSIQVRAIKEAGATGTVINHSEHRLDLETIEKTINAAKEHDLESLVCAQDPELAAQIAKFKPTAIAVEPPELIGSGISVSKAKPEVITDTVALVKQINLEMNVLCGAGITCQEDARRAIELGAQGVLVASGVVKSSDPKSKVLDILNGLKN